MSSTLLFKSPHAGVLTCRLSVSSASPLPQVCLSSSARPLHLSDSGTSASLCVCVCVDSFVGVALRMTPSLRQAQVLACLLTRVCGGFLPNPCNAAKKKKCRSGGRRAEHDCACSLQSARRGRPRPPLLPRRGQAREWDGRSGGGAALLDDVGAAAVCRHPSPFRVCVCVCANSMLPKPPTRHSTLLFPSSSPFLAPFCGHRVPLSCIIGHHTRGREGTPPPVFCQRILTSPPLPLPSRLHCPSSCQFADSRSPAPPSRLLSSPPHSRQTLLSIPLSLSRVPAALWADGVSQGA